MNRNLLPIVAVSILSISLPSYGRKLKCDFNLQMAPLCPEDGALMLDDRYPIMGAAVSTAQGGIQFVSQFIDKLMTHSSTLPLVTVVSTEKEYQEIIKAIQSKSALTPSEKSAWIEKLRHVKYSIVQNNDSSGAVNWQQDFFETQFDPKTGRPIIREISNYLATRKVNQSLVKDISKSFADCGVTEGATLKIKSKPSELKSGMYGGNIEGLPGGLCMLGRDKFSSDAQWTEYAKEACGNLDRVVKTPSDFLKVGHTDEIVNVIKVPNEPEPCNFAIAVASPRKALEVLEASPDEVLFEASFLDDKLNGDVIGACSSALRQKIDSFRSKPEKNETTPAKGTVKLFQALWIQKSYANAEESFFGVDRSNPEVKSLIKKVGELRHLSPPPDIKRACGELKNSDLIRLYQEPTIGYNGEALVPKFRLVQDAIQKKMDAFKEELRAKFKKYSSQCEPRIVDVPMLFQGNYDSNEKSVTEARSLFPNSTNGLMLEKNFIAPTPGNKSFLKEIESAYKKLGVEVKTIDTYFAHAMSGNLHCSSNLIRYCRPRN